MTPKRVSRSRSSWGALGARFRKGATTAPVGSSASSPVLGRLPLQSAPVPRILERPGEEEAQQAATLLVQQGGIFGDFAPPRALKRRVSYVPLLQLGVVPAVHASRCCCCCCCSFCPPRYNEFTNPFGDRVALIDRSHAPIRPMTSVHLVRVRSAVRAACSLLPALLDARQRAQIARLYVQRMQQLVKRGPETQEAKAQKAEARRVLARNTERKYLANRVINDASAGKGIVNRERIDLLRV